MSNKAGIVLISALIVLLDNNASPANCLPTSKINEFGKADIVKNNKEAGLKDGSTANLPHSVICFSEFLKNLYSNHQGKEFNGMPQNIRRKVAEKTIEYVQGSEWKYSYMTNSSIICIALLYLYLYLYLYYLHYLYL